MDQCILNKQNWNNILSHFLFERVVSNHISKSLIHTKQHSNDMLPHCAIAFGIENFSMVLNVNDTSMVVLYFTATYLQAQCRHEVSDMFITTKHWNNRPNRNTKTLETQKISPVIITFKWVHTLNEHNHHSNECLKQNTYWNTFQPTHKTSIR